MEFYNNFIHFNWTHQSAWAVHVPMKKFLYPKYLYKLKSMRLLTPANNTLYLK